MLEIREESDLVLDENQEEEEKLVTLVIEEPKEKWDCESILSECSSFV